jgi:hypothetical protein
VHIQNFDVELTRDGTLFDHAEVQAAVDAAGQLTDMFVLSHGWNNNKEEATGLYDRLTENLIKLMGISAMQSLAPRRFGAVRIFWPSKRFEEASLIPGGGAAAVQGDESHEAVQEALERLRGNPLRLANDDNDGGEHQDKVRDKIIDSLKLLIPELSSGSRQESARREFVLTLRSLVDPAQIHEDDASASFFADDPLQLFQKFQEGVAAPVGPAVAGGGAGMDGAGSATGLRDAFSGVISAARRLANFTTYNDMKQRAGLVGSTGVAQLLMLLRQKNPALKLHLVGHSFGGRLVTAAANNLPPGTPAVTLSLLQAAYSHNGLAEDFDNQKHDGAFRTLLSEKRASGPIIITHTQNDRAVGIAYPLASRISHDVASSLGDRDDPYGGMGRNGAQHTREVDFSVNTLLPPGGQYQFKQGSIYNLKADDFIKDHGDVSGQQVAYAILNAVLSVQEPAFKGLN